MTDDARTNAMIRRTSLLVAFCLLTTAATAFAEAAWMLWDQSVYAVGGQEPALSLQRLLVEMHYANVRTYMTSRCVYRGDRELPRGLKGK